MTYTQSQIERAKAGYNAMLQYRTVESYQPEHIGYNTANQRADAHNKIVSEILNGNKEVEREWKLFFLTEAVRADRKAAASIAKKESNKIASCEVLEPIKEAKKLVAFGKWLNTSGNPYRSEHFSKKYTAESVAAFMNTL